jgi:hypothetical protein
MSGTSFSALMPSVLRLIGGEESGCVHLAAQEAAPIAEWGGCFRSEEDVDRILQIPEPLLVLLSLAGYGVPEVVLSAQGMPQSDRISVAMPTLEIKRGTTRSWDAAPSARVGLRVCPTASNPLDLGVDWPPSNPASVPRPVDGCCCQCRRPTLERRWTTACRSCGWHWRRRWPRRAPEPVLPR